MKPTTLLVTAITALALCSNSIAKKAAPAAEAQPIVQIALLLDTSGSMDGLLSQAKTQLWKVVNEFIDAEQNGHTPVVQVALYEYGKDTVGKESNWVRQIQPLTRDLDKVSEELFGLTTNGGSEFCGAAIERASLDLSWDKSPDTFKAIFIAGNEPFTQGPVDADKACKNAIAGGIIVNTIHCGSESDGIAGNWKQGAMVADGSFMTIDQNAAVAHIEAPQDKEIAELNTRLNKTYVTYGGAKAELMKQNQIVQDNNADMTNSIAQRAVCKASTNYWNDSWDLVDAAKKNDFNIEDVKVEDLPKEMQKLSIEERKAFVQEKSKERKKIQEQILDLNRDREEFVETKRKEAGEEDTVGDAMVKAIRSQAESKAITFK